eukprot:6210353-Pyramimonas_sp.AAC.1
MNCKDPYGCERGGRERKMRTHFVASQVAAFNDTIPSAKNTGILLQYRLWVLSTRPSGYQGAPPNSAVHVT